MVDAAIYIYICIARYIYRLQPSIEFRDHALVWHLTGDLLTTKHCHLLYIVWTIAWFINFLLLDNPLDWVLIWKWSFGTRKPQNCMQRKETHRRCWVCYHMLSDQPIEGGKIAMESIVVYCKWFWRQFVLCHECHSGTGVSQKGALFDKPQEWLQWDALKAGLFGIVSPQSCICS